MQPTTKGGGVAARVAYKCPLNDTLLPLGDRASYRTHTQRNDIAPHTYKFARATPGMPSDHATREHWHIWARTLTAQPGCKSSRSSLFEHSHFKRQGKSLLERKEISLRWLGETRSQRSKLVQQDKITLLETQAMAPNGLALARL